MRYFQPLSLRRNPTDASGDYDVYQVQRAISPSAAAKVLEKLLNEYGATASTTVIPGENAVTTFDVKWRKFKRGAEWLKETKADLQRALKEHGWTVREFTTDHVDIQAMPGTTVDDDSAGLWTLGFIALGLGVAYGIVNRPAGR